MDVRRFSRIQRPWQLWDELRLRRNLGVYVHVPFCLSRCGYCDFLTFGAGQHPPGMEPASYAQLLHSEIRQRGEQAHKLYAPQQRYVDSVFFGGGTPTYLQPEQLCSIVRAVLDSFPLDARGVEVTVEANPDTLNENYLAALHTAGVNRLSLGIQATQPRHLAFLNRTHRWLDIQPVLRALQAGPIGNYSFDLLYAVPRLTPRELSASIERLLAFRPQHISAYELTVEHETPLARWAAQFGHQLPAPETIAGQQQQLERQLAGTGLYRYEVSNYARPGYECRHNLRYWRGGDYFGLGLGAASRIGSIVVNNPRAYPEYAASYSGPTWPPDAVLEQLQLAHELGALAQVAPAADRFLRLRTRAGLPRAETEPLVLERFGASWLRRQWLELRTGRLGITSRGLNFADTLAKALD